MFLTVQVIANIWLLKIPHGRIGLNQALRSIHWTPEMTDTRPPTRYRFGVFEVDLATGELRRRGIRVKLHSQPFQLLFLLLERPGEVLTREEICRELWPDDTFVDYEHGVNSAVNRLREALGDTASNPRFVETLARRGYRFLVPVERIPLDPVAMREDAPAATVTAQIWEAGPVVEAETKPDFSIGY